MAEDWNAFYRAFSPNGTLADGTPAYFNVYHDPVPASQGPTKRTVSTVPINPATGMPFPQQTAVQAIDQATTPSTDIVKTYNDRLPPSGPLAFSGEVATNPNPFNIKPLDIGAAPPAQPAVVVAPAPAPPPQTLADLFSRVLSSGAPTTTPSPTVAPVVAAHAPTTPLSALAQMFAPAPAGSALANVRNVVSGRSGNTFASAGNNNASAARAMSPGGSLTGSQW